MRIAYICKRFYMGKDVILDRYARLYEIPFQLGRLGHDVQAFCIAYSSDVPALDTIHETGAGALHWRSISWGRFIAPAIITYPYRLLRQLRAFDPDLLIAASDIPHIALGAWLARKLGRPYVADLYDNFEGFGQARIPGMVMALRKSVFDADLVLTTSEPLRQLVLNEYRARGEVIAMPSTIDKTVFRPRDRKACRKGLGLPMHAPLIGTAGGLHRDKGIETLYAAWRRLSERRPDVHLVLAGPHEPGLRPPAGDRVHYLGALPHDRVAELFCALDVGAICILDTPFGRYCFPQKAYEMLACRLPVVAADVGAMKYLFAGSRERSLYTAGDADALADRLQEQLASPIAIDVAIDDWQQIIANLELRLPHR